jgi:SAM-dependent methyltransferase
MLKTSTDKNKKEWKQIFSQAKHGHILWDGNAADPSDPEHAYNTAHQFVNFAKNFGMFKQKSKILDIGCGNGRFAICFSEMDVSYEGVEPMKECIDFCHFAFKDFKHLKFNFQPIKSPEYNLNEGTDMSDFTLQYDDNSFDDIIIYSVFTHLKDLRTADRYMQEIKRVLKIGGKLFSTWYRSPPNKNADTYIGRTVYHEWDIINLMQGFKMLFCYGGHSDQYYDQWGAFQQLVQK